MITIQTPLTLTTNLVGLSSRSQANVFRAYFQQAGRIFGQAIIGHFFIAIVLALVYEKYWSLAPAAAIVAAFFAARSIVPKTMIACAIGGVLLQLFPILHYFQANRLTEALCFFFTCSVILIVAYDWRAFVPAGIVAFINVVIVTHYLTPAQRVSAALVFQYGIGAGFFVLCAWYSSRRRDSIIAETMRRLDLDRMAQIARESPVSIAVTDTAGRLVWVNSCFLRMTGASFGEAIGRSMQELIGGPAVSTDLTGEIEIQTRSGRRLWVHRTINPMPEPLKGYFVIDSDVTARRAAEVDRERLSSIVEATTDLITICDPHGKVLYLNPATYRLLGRETLGIGEPIARMYPKWAMNTIMSVGVPAAARNRVWLGESAVIDSQQREIPVSQVIIAHRGDDGHIDFFSSIIRDIRDQKRLEEEYRETQKLESLGVLAGGIAHDFNNLMMGVIGSAECIREKLPASSSLFDSLDMIDRSATHAADLCQLLLAYAGKSQFAVCPVNLADVARDTIELLRYSASKRAEIDLTVADDPPWVAGDAAQMRQLMMNLILNAAEALGEHQGTIRVELTAVEMTSEELDGCRFSAAAGPGRFIRLVVSDTGQGMDSNTQERAFDPFFSTKFTGRGLGLSAVLGIVRSHRGAIQLESAVGTGTTFRIYLPPTVAPARLEPVAPTEVPSWNRRSTILIVDDEPDVLKVTSTMVETLGLSVECAGSGQAGLDRLRSAAGAFRLALVDLTMPDITGVEVLESLRREKIQIPVILMSGYSPQDVSARLHDANPAAILKKPFRKKELIDAIESAIGRDSISV